MAFLVPDRDKYPFRLGDRFYWDNKSNNIWITKMIETLLENSTKMNMLKIRRFPCYPSSMCCGLCSFISRPALFERKRGKYSKKFQNVWVFDQVCGQDGWILVKFFFCVFMDRDEVEVHKLAKKEGGQYPAILTEQTWSIKDLLYGFWWNFACRIQRVVPRGQDGSILPARVANHSARFGSSCPLAEL